jgi:hypothetical protein
MVSSMLRHLLLVSILSLICFAQTAPTSALSGTVKDASGGVVPGATVVLTNTGTQWRRELKTGPEGQFSFVLVPVGRYSIRVNAPGFSTYEQSGITLEVDSRPSLSITLAVGGTAEQVVVSADAAMVATESGTLSQVVQQRYIENLPLNGRNPATLIRMVPGTVTGVGTTTAGYANTSDTIAISVNGARGNEVNFKLDGATHMDNVTNLNATYPNPDAVAEFSVQTSNFSAQYGEAAGAVVNVVTRSGTNAMHGSLFEFDRNGALNARNFFAAQHDNLKRHQFGGSLGGPILRNRLFYFASYQGTLINNTSFTNTAFVPTLAQRSGDFSGTGRSITDPETNKPFPGGIIPADRISPIAAAILKQVPTTTDPTGRLLYARPDSSSSHQGFGKLDYNAGRHQISGSAFYVRYDDPGWNGNGTLLTARIGQYQTTRSFKGQDVFTIRPNLLNTFIASGLLLDSTNTRTSAFYIKDFGNVAIATPPKDASELELTVTGFGGWGSVTNNPPGEWIRRNIEFSDAVNYIHGRNIIAFGVEFTPRIVFDSNTRFQQSGNFNFSGQFTGNGLADLLLGKVATFQQSAGKFKRTRGKEVSAFAEDKFVMSQALTLTFGVRWDPFLPYHDVLGQVSGYQAGATSQRFLNAPPGAIFPGDPGFPDGGMQNDWNNFAPRFGFAWTPRRGAHPTVVRGGYGIFYVRPFPRLYNNFVETAPFSPSVSLTGVDLADPYGSAGVKNPFPPFAPVSLTKDAPFVLPTAYAFFKPDWTVGYSQSWNFTVEQQFTADLLLRAAYVGNKGTHLQSFRERDPAVYRPGATLRDTDARRPLYPYYASMKELVNDGNSIYHALQLTLEKRFSRNFSFLTFYTRSKSIDDESVNNQFTISNPNPYDPRFNRGLSDFDVPHNFRISGVYDLPRLTNAYRALRFIAGGWTITEILDWRSGTPFTLSSGRDNSFSGIGQDRADIIGNPALSNDRPKAQLIQQYFDTSLVKPNAVGTFGNSPRNFLRGLPVFNVDAGIEKKFALGEHARFELRGEFFNLLNHANLGTPGTNQSAASTFGVITSASEPRIVQIGAKIIF